jgi:hypothetical protein
MKSRNFAMVAAMAALLLATAAVSMVSPENALAYKKSQATSQTSACGNGGIPTNIGCQNTGSQIQGDKNSVALAAQQTFPEVVQEEPSPQPEVTCEECFTDNLTPEQIAALEREPVFFVGVQEACEIAATLTPEELAAVLTDFEATLIGFLGIDPATAQAVVDCVAEFFGSA